MPRKILQLTLSVAMTILPQIAASLTLDQAMQIGRERSLKQVAPQIQQARIEGQIEEAWSNALPQVDGMAAYQRTFKAPVMFFPGENGEIEKIKTMQDNTGLIEATVTQPIYTFGRIGAGLDAAFATRRSNEHTISQTGKNLELDIMKGYWAVLLTTEVVTVRRDALAVAEGSLERVMRLRDVGMLSEFDVLRARSQVSSLVPTVHQSENDLRIAELAFRDLLGVPLDTSFTVEGSLSDFDVSLSGDTSLAGALQRDDLEAMRDQVRAYENIYTIYRNAGLPTIGSQLKYSWQWGDDGWEVNDMNSASSLTGGVSVIFPIWTSGKNSGKAQQIRADLRQLQLGLTTAERGIQLQHAAAINTYQTAILNEESAEVAVKEAEEAGRIAALRLDNGQVTPLDLQTAQLTETSARLGLASARYNRLVAAAELKLASGQSPYTR